MSGIDENSRCVDAYVGNRQRVTLELTVGELYAVAFNLDREHGKAFAIAAGIATEQPRMGTVAQMDYGAAMCKVNDALAKAGGLNDVRLDFAAILSEIEQKRAALREAS